MFRRKAASLVGGALFVAAMLTAGAARTAFAGAAPGDVLQPFAAHSGDACRMGVAKGGLDRLIAVHARVGRWTLLALVVHGVAVTLAYAALAGSVRSPSSLRWSAGTPGCFPRPSDSASCSSPAWGRGGAYVAACGTGPGGRCTWPCTWAWRSPSRTRC